MVNPTTAAAAASADDWTQSLQSTSLARHDVEAEAIAACHGLSNHPSGVTLPRQNQQHEPKQSRPFVKSTSEICVAQVLASLSSSSVDASSPQPQVLTASTKSTAPIRRRQTLAHASDKRENRSRSSNDVIKTTSIARNSELSTINASDIGGISVPVQLSSAANVVVRSVSVSQTTSSAFSFPHSRSQSVTVTSSATSAVMPADSSKHSFYRPMKRSSEVNIAYDETIKQYVQTVKKSTDRRKSLGCPGYQSIQSTAGDTSCRRSLSTSVATNGSCETKENETTNTMTNVRDNRHRRLSLRKENVVSSPPSPLLACEESTSDLSSMEIVMRCCLGKSETKTVEEQTQPLQAIITAPVSSATCQPRKTRNSSQPAGKVSKCPTDEMVSLTSNSTTTGVRSSENEDASGSLLPVGKPRSRAKKTSTAVKKSGDSKKNSAKGRPTKKNGDKVESRTSGRRSGNSDSSPVDSTELNVTKKRRGRLKADKPAKTLKEKDSAAKVKSAKNKTKSNDSPCKTPSSSSNRSASPVKRKQRSGSLKRNDITAASSKQPSENGVTSNGSPCKTPSSSSNRLASPVKRKRRSSSLKPNAVTAVNPEQPAENAIVRLPDFECFLTGPTRNVDELADITAATVTESCTLKSVSETTDSGLQQNNSISAQFMTPTVSSLVPQMSEETTDCISSPTNTPSLPSPSTLSAGCWTVPQSPSITFATVTPTDTRVTEHSVDDVRHATDNNVGLPERECDLSSSQSSSHSVENRDDIANSTPLSGQFT